MYCSEYRTLTSRKPSRKSNCDHGQFEIKLVVEGFLWMEFLSIFRPEQEENSFNLELAEYENLSKNI
jgi:hypothetical protein